MDTIGKPIPSSRRSSAYAIGSIALHVCLIAFLIHQRTPWVAPMRLPGSEHGKNLLLTYSPGRAPVPATAPHPKTQPRDAKASVALPALPKPTPAPPVSSPNTQAPASDQPSSTTGADSLGSGNIDIALARYFPTPKPDLSTLPHGTRGDVILDIVIDTNGKIADIKMTSGLGYGIDETVIATVQQWTFKPATKDGLPVPSEQELHFHYEKS